MWKVISESMLTVEMDVNNSVQVGLVGGSSAAASAWSLLWKRLFQLGDLNLTFELRNPGMVTGMSMPIMPSEVCT